MADSTLGDPDEPADPEGEERWRLDPERFPRQVVLELPEPLLEQLQQLAECRGRNLGEIVVDLLDRQLHPQGCNDQEEPPEG